MPKPTPFNTELIKGVIRSFLGDFKLEVDRQNQIVVIRAKGQEVLYTYAELIEEIDQIFNGGK